MAGKDKRHKGAGDEWNRDNIPVIRLYPTLCQETVCVNYAPVATAQRGKRTKGLRDDEANWYARTPPSTRWGYGVTNLLFSLFISSLLWAPTWRCSKDQHHSVGEERRIALVSVRVMNYRFVALGVLISKDARDFPLVHSPPVGN